MNKFDLPFGTSNAQQYKNQLPGMHAMEARLKYYGGTFQQDRMISDKRKTLDRAVLYSYQGALVRKLVFTDKVRALINPNKLKQDYDDKIISIGFEHEFHAGDVFEWCNTNSYWLIYLQDLTELAYFRGEIRRCRYQIEWLDENGDKQSTYAAIRGPVETKIDYIQKHGISIDNPNLSLNILMPLNNATKAYFKRYNKFYLQNDDVCWRVEAIDWISMPGVLEINATEYYSNTTEDDIEHGLVGALMVKDTDINDDKIESLIIGETFIKPKRDYTYHYSGVIKSNWELDSKLPIQYRVSEDGKDITIKWTASYSGQFDLKHGDFVKTIIVESLF